MHSFGTLRPSAAAPRPEYRHPRWGEMLCDASRHSAQEEADLLFARRGLSLRFWFHPCAGKMAGQKTGPADVSAAIHGIDLSDIVTVNIHQGSTILLIMRSFLRSRQGESRRLRCGSLLRRFAVLRQNKTSPARCGKRGFFLRVENRPECGKRRQNNPVPCSLAAGRAHASSCKGTDIPAR